MILLLRIHRMWWTCRIWWVICDCRVKPLPLLKRLLLETFIKRVSSSSIFRTNKWLRFSWMSWFMIRTKRKTRWRGLMRTVVIVNRRRVGRGHLRSWTVRFTPLRVWSRFWRVKARGMIMGIMPSKWGSSMRIWMERRMWSSRKWRSRSICWLTPTTMTWHCSIMFWYTPISRWRTRMLPMCCIWGRRTWSRRICWRSRVIRLPRMRTIRIRRVRRNSTRSWSTLARSSRDLRVTRMVSRLTSRLTSKSTSRISASTWSSSHSWVCRCSSISTWTVRS